MIAEVYKPDTTKTTKKLDTIDIRNSFPKNKKVRNPNCPFKKFQEFSHELPKLGCHEKYFPQKQGENCGENHSIHLIRKDFQQNYPLVSGEKNLMTAQFMELAYNEAIKAWHEDEIPIGAVAVYKGEVIARNHNRVEQLKNATAHAEMLILNELSSHFNEWRLSEITLYVTKEPCPMCAGAIFKSRIKNVVIGTYDPQQGCLGGCLNFNEKLILYHKVSVYLETLSGACEQLIKTYFQLRRQLSLR